MLALATKVVSDYGKVLAQVPPGVWGMPESLLPHPRATIRYAILTLLGELGHEHAEVKEGLRQGYVYLAQFVADTEAETIARGHGNLSGGEDEASSLSAVRIINRIKLEMERALDELRGHP